MKLGSFEHSRAVPPYVLGYHGTTQASAGEILSGSTYKPSLKSYDWLGSGWYVWQDDPMRAEEWAQARHGRDIAVLEVTIDISACFDLIQRKYLVPLQKHAQRVLNGLPEDRIALMRQSELLHDIDCTLIETFCEAVRRPDGSPRFTTVRGCFKEGEPVFDWQRPLAAASRVTSALQSMDHVQIAVRDSSAIVNCRQL